MLVKARNILTEGVNKTHLSTSSAIGATALYVKNVSGFGAGWGVQLGETGQEKSEVVLLGASAPSGTTFALNGTTKFDHPSDTPAYAIKWDTIIFKRSTAGTSGTATAMTDGTIAIQADSDYTTFDDTSGSASYGYRASYYNTYLGEASSDSDWLTPSGYAFYSLAKIRDRIKSKLESANYIKNDEVIDDWINEWLEKMTNIMIKVNRDYAIGTTDVAYAGTATLGTITSTDFKEVRKIEYTQDGTNWYIMKQLDLNDFDPSDTYSSTYPYFYYQGDNIIGRKPSDAAGTARVYYYKTSSTIYDDGDELPIPMQNYTKSFVDYSLAQAYYLDNKGEMGDRFMAQANSELAMFQNEIAPRHKTGVKYIDIKAPVQAEDDSMYI